MLPRARSERQPFNLKLKLPSIHQVIETAKEKRIERRLSKLASQNHDTQNNIQESQAATKSTKFMLQVGEGERKVEVMIDAD